MLISQGDSEIVFHSNTVSQNTNKTPNSKERKTERQELQSLLLLCCFLLTPPLHRGLIFAPQDALQSSQKPTCFWTQDHCCYGSFGPESPHPFLCASLTVFQAQFKTLSERASWPLQLRCQRSTMVIALRKVSGSVDCYGDTGYSTRCSNQLQSDQGKGDSTRNYDVGWLVTVKT